MSVPKLRFKEFTNEWNYRCLSEISTDITYGMNSASTEFDGLNKYIRITDIDDETGNFKPSNLVSPSSKLEDKFLVKKDDILFARTGASTGKTYLYNIKDGKLYFAGFLIKAHIANHNSNFIFQQTKLEKYKKWVKLTSMRSGQPGINSEEYGKCIFSITSLSEENKIAQFLSLLDKKIELQTKKIEALKLFKKGLFDTQLKTNEKELIMFDDFLDEATEKSSIQNQYPVLSSTSKGLFLQSDYFKKQASSENNVGYKILKRNQLVLSPQNLWMGNININNIFDIGIVSPSYRVYNIDIKKIDLNYFNYWIKTPKALYSYLISSEQGASIVRRNLNIEMFNQISLKIPDLEKQHIIGNRIYQFYLKIDLEEEKLKLLYKLKKGLMQNMFI